MEPVTQSIPVPSEWVGLLIGRNGVEIQRLCEESGARVRFGSDESYFHGVHFKYAHMNGTPRELDTAKRLLMRHIHAIASRDRRRYEG